MDELQPRDFSFNAPYGACPDCLGIGSREEVDPDLVIPDPSLSLNEGAVAPFKSGNYYPQVMRAVLLHYGIDPDTPWQDIPKKVQKKLFYGAPGVEDPRRLRNGRWTRDLLVRRMGGHLCGGHASLQGSFERSPAPEIRALLFDHPVCDVRRQAPQSFHLGGHGERQEHPRRSVSFQLLFR